MAFIQSSPLRSMSSSDSPAPPPPPSTTSNPSPTESTSTFSSLTSPRSRKQLSLFFAGAAFLSISTLITRRSLVRRRLAIFPTFYHPSNATPKIPVNGALEAFEALNIATINVVSFMMLLTGGMLWAFDISGMEDMRRLVRGGLGVDGSGTGEKEVEEGFEEWLASVLERKKGKEGNGDKAAELSDWEGVAAEGFKEERETKARLEELRRRELEVKEGELRLKEEELRLREKALERKW